MWSTFWRFSLWALQFLLFEQFRWISLAILVLLGIATVVTLNSSAARSRPITSYLFPLLLSAAFPLTIAIAVLFPARSAANPNHVGQWLLNGLDILCALFAIYYFHLGGLLSGYLDRAQFDRALRTDLGLLLTGLG